MGVRTMGKGAEAERKTSPATMAGGGIKVKVGEQTKESSMHVGVCLFVAGGGCHGARRIGG